MAKDKEEKFQIILLGSVIICAIFTFVTIAWAAFTTTLKISGTATIKSQSWNVYWSAASVDNSTGKTSTTATTIDSIGSATNIIELKELKADFNTPGQKAVYNMTMANGGTFNAKLTNYTTPTIKCKGASDSSWVTQSAAASKADVIAKAAGVAGMTSAERICNFIDYELVTKTASFTSSVNTTPITAGTSFSTLVNNLVLDKATSSGLATGGQLELELTIKFDELTQLPAEYLPTEDVEIKYETFEAKFDQV